MDSLGSSLLSSSSSPSVLSPSSGGLGGLGGGGGGFDFPFLIGVFLCKARETVLVIVGVAVRLVLTVVVVRTGSWARASYSVSGTAVSLVKG